MARNSLWARFSVFGGTERKCPADPLKVIDDLQLAFIQVESILQRRPGGFTAPQPEVKKSKTCNADSR